VFKVVCREGRFRHQRTCGRVPFRRRLLQAPVEGPKKEYELVLSPDIVAEFEGVLLRKFSLSQSELTDVRTLLAEATNQICLEVDPIEPVSRDPDDDKILACASVSQADYLVTGDEDLLVVRQYGGTKILAPRDFESLFAD